MPQTYKGYTYDQDALGVADDGSAHCLFHVYVVKAGGERVSMFQVACRYAPDPNAPGGGAGDVQARACAEGEQRVRDLIDGRRVMMGRRYELTVTTDGEQVLRTQSPL